MIRTCDGADPYLIGHDRGPCSCGLVFNDVERLTIWPHEPVGPKLTDAEVDQLVAMLGLGDVIAPARSGDAEVSAGGLARRMERHGIDPGDPASWR